MNKKIILLSTLVLASVLAFSQTAFADNATLSVSPATATKNVGTTFNASVNLDPQGNKVCVVKGTLSFTNLTCKSITLASGIMATITPTCASPSFTLGIPKCTTVAQNLMTISASGSKAGTATATLAGVKVIGAGTAVAFSANGANYSIVQAPAPKPATTPENVQPAPTTQQVTTPTQETTPNTTIPANAGAASLANSGASQWFNWILIIAVILIIIYAVYYFVTRKKK